MASWTNKAYEAICAKHPELEGKSESVALAVWALSQNKEMTPQDFRDLSDKSGVNVKGRAVGSAREIVGLKPKAKKKSAKRKAKKGAARSKSTRSSGAITSLHDVVAGMQQLEREHAHMRKTLEKLRDLIDASL